MSDHDDRNNDEILLLRAIVNDDQKSFKAIFMKYYSPLVILADRYIHSLSESEDVVQDMFFHLWKNRKNIQIKTSLRSLLLASVKNRSIDYVRKFKVRDKYESLCMERDSQAEDILYSESELKDALNKALSKLPEKVKQVFLMNRFQGLRYSDIAQKNGISVKTVEAYMTKALKMLRYEMSDYIKQ